MFLLRTLVLSSISLLLNQATIHPSVDSASASSEDVLTDEITQKIVKQVEYYFSDANLATTDHLMRFISKDQEGFVPISVIASFKKIKAFVSNHGLLAAALHTSSKLVVSEDGKKVRRQHPLTDTDIEDLQSRTVVAENLPEDHTHKNLEKIFCAVGSVKTIHICHPQNSNGGASVASRLPKMAMLVSNKLHALVEYETVEQAEKAVSELNDERNWRSGLRVRLLLRRTTKCTAQTRERKAGHEGENGEEDDASMSDQAYDTSQPSESSNNHWVKRASTVRRVVQGGVGAMVEARPVGVVNITITVAGMQLALPLQTTQSKMSTSLLPSSL